MAIDLTVNEHSLIPLSVDEEKGADFQHGEEYILAVSPTASVTQTETGAVITVKDKFGTTSAVLMNGQDGKDGKDGTDGKDGKDGADGAQGPKGDTGERGPQGIQGPQGERGLTGETGPQGPKGDTGADGPQGLTGATGPQGPKGDKGDTGATGPKGDKGDTGEQGPQGPKGDTGETGVEGPTGPEGPQGPKGDTGETGRRGTSTLKVTTAPSSYTKQVGLFVPKYRLSLATIRQQSAVEEIYLGDIIEYSFYHYAIGYIDGTYAYTGNRTSIRGATGATGDTGPAGSDATVTYGSVIDALGFTPLNGESIRMEAADVFAEEIAKPTFVATDAMSKSVIQNAFGMDAPITVPSDITSVAVLINRLNPRTWFVWLNGTEVEFSRLGVSLNGSNNAVTMYLRGRTSTASGVMGVDNAWTVTPN